MAVKEHAGLRLNLELYRKLYLIRRAEQKIIELYREDDMKTPMHMSMGQEAISAGVCAALGESGQIFSSYRSHAAYLARTEDVEMFFLEMYGKDNILAGGKAGSMHLSDHSKGHLCSSAVVGSVLPLAAGAAFASRQTKSGRVACVFFGDGALEEGVFWETLNVSAVMKLPVFLVCEDNGFAVHTAKATRQGFRSITETAEKFNCHVFAEDTTDVEKIYHLTQKALQASKTDPKPVFMHLKCYRYLEHVGINEDFDAGYRPKKEFEAWKEKDCVALQRRKLLTLGSEEAVVSEERAVDARISESIRKAKAAAFPSKESLYRGVFFGE